MRSLTLSLGALMTTFVALLWAIAHCTGPMPMIAAAHPPAVPDVPCTAYAKAPPVGTGPRYKVTLVEGWARAWLNRSKNPPSEFACPRLPPIHDSQFPSSRLSASFGATNRHGEIVGFYGGGDSGAYLNIIARPFFYQRGRLHFLPTLPNYRIMHPDALNASGEIVGDALVDLFPADMDSPTHAVCWVHGKVYDLGTGAASGINHAGDIVGDSGAGRGDFSYAAHALLWTHGYRYELNSCIPPHSGWVLTNASAIDGKGRIVGHGLFHGKEKAFLLTPRKKALA